MNYIFLCHLLATVTKITVLSQKEILTEEMCTRTGRIIQPFLSIDFDFLCSSC